MADRGRGRGGRGGKPAGRGFRGGPTRGRGRGALSDAHAVALNYAAIDDYVADPLAASASRPPRPAYRGRGAPVHFRAVADSPSSFPRSGLHPRGLGFATPPSGASGTTTPHHLQGRELLKPVKFVRGDDQPLLIDPDAVLMQPIVHDDHHRSQRSSAASQPVPLPAVEEPAPTSKRTNSTEDAADRSIESIPSEQLFVIDVQGDQSDLPATDDRPAAINGQTSDDSDDDSVIVYVPPSKHTAFAELPSSSTEQDVPQERPTASSIPAPEVIVESATAEVIAVSAPAERPGKSTTANRKANKKAAKREARRARRQGKGAGAASEQRIPREGDSDLEWGSDGPPAINGSLDVEELTATLQSRALTDADDDEHGMELDVDDDDDEGEEDLSFAASFVASMSVTNQVSTDDIAAEAAVNESDDTPWQTDPDGDSASEAEDIIAQVEQERFEGYPSLDKGKGKAMAVASAEEGDEAEEQSEEEESSSEEDESSEDIDIDDEVPDEDDEDLLVGKWEDADMLLDAHAGIFERGNRAKRNKVFRAIEKGDFSDLIEDEDDFTLQPRRKDKGKGKAKARALDDDDTKFIASLQAQWERDRASKADRKRARAAARAEAGPTKKQRKAAKRKTGDEADSLDNHDLQAIHVQIRSFAIDIRAGPILGLPPTSKRQRVAVHLLAECYNLKSKSIGKGANRAPVLYRTARTAVHGADQRKIDSIIGIAESGLATPGSVKPRGRLGGLWRELDGTSDRNKASPVAKNREGAIVGHGAEALDEDNVGFRLLARMGWSAGERIGVTGGIDTPIEATIKTSRRGLGH